MHGVNPDAYEMSRADEARLSKELRRGDPAALERFQSMLTTPVYRFVFYRLSGRTDDVEEIVQETFLAALEGLPRFRHECSLYTWLCGIAKNRIARHRRAAYRSRLATAIESVDSELDAILADLDRPLPDEALEREETQDLVGATMAALPLQYQEVLVEKYVSANSVDEIARQRGTSSKAIESTLTRARGAFRRAWELLARKIAGDRP